KGIEIMENLIGHTSGFAVPTYVIDAPGGGGKIPMMPNYTVSSGVNRVVLRNYEGVICTYPEPDTYQRRTCDGDCVHCMLDHENPEGIEARPVGIAKLLADYDNASTLVPADTPRMERRNE
ncbi:MAG TPA: lysine 2,3-aminomutase, partial [Methanolinea sp.]|nr:lysine 2,3-aminomutase [Methanolinea sp.]